MKKALRQFVEPAASPTSEFIEKLVRAIGNHEMRAAEIMAKLKLKSRANFRKNYLVPAQEGKFIVPISAIKNNPRQKYRPANSNHLRLIKLIKF